MNQIDKAVQAIRDAAEQEINKLLSSRVDQDWKPEHGDKYWFISSLGRVLQGTWAEHSRDHHSRLAMGNVYQTRQLAEQARYRHDARVSVYSMIRDANRDENWRADFSDIGQYKYFVTYNHVSGNLVRSSSVYTQSLPVEMYGSKEVIDRCISQLPKDLKRILGGQV